MTVTNFTLSSWQRRIDQVNLAIRKHRQRIENLEKERELLEKKMSEAKELRGDK